MKKLITLIALLGIVAGAQAQFIQGPAQFRAITNAGTWTPGASNGATAAVSLSAAQAPWVPVGANGFAVTIKAYATNAALTTNVWFVLESSADGVNAITNNTVTVAYLPTGVATNSYHTNFVTSTSALLGNITAVRLKSYQQTNGVIGGSLAGNLFVEKFIISTR